MTRNNFSGLEITQGNGHPSIWRSIRTQNNLATAKEEKE